MRHLDMPRVVFAYQTEFVASSTLGRRQIVRANIGVKLFSGLVLKDFALTLFGEKDFNPNIQAQSLGMELGMVYEKRFKNSGKLYYMLNARDYIFSTTSSAYDPKYSLELELRYDLSLYKNLILYFSSLSFPSYTIFYHPYCSACDMRTILLFACTTTMFSLFFLQF